MQEIQILKDLVVVFGCAALIVYLSHRLKQSPIVGFVITGMLVGPFGFSWVDDVASVNTLATIGVMILLFSLGLEFSLKKLMETRRAVFVTGPLQIAGTAIPVMLVAVQSGVPASVALVYGALIGVSSTSVFMKVLAERGEVDSIHGRIGLGVSIFQDLFTIPVMICIPLFAKGEGLVLSAGAGLAKALAIILAVVVVARYVFPTVLRGILRTRSKELFLITSVFIFLGTARVTSSAGISLALGSFLAGLILSESEYGQQIFADVIPFRDSLNSLFFISLGMLVDPRFIGLNLPTILGTTVAVVLGKTVVTVAAVWASRFSLQVAILAGVALAQIGEFSFILLQAASGASLIGTGPYQILLAASLATVVLAPVAFGVTRRLLSRRDWPAFGRSPSHVPESSATDGPFHDHVIICGFGLGGRNIARVLKANKTPYVVLDLNAQTVRELSRTGEPILFGDCTSRHILEMAGIRRARVIVFVISDPFATRTAIRIAREMNPELVILTRTKRVSDMDELWNQGSTEVIAEEFEASLELMTRILRVFNAPRAMVAAEIKSIRDQRFGIFRERQTTIPRMRLSSEVDIYTETWEVPRDSAWHGTTVAQTRLRGETGALILGIIRGNSTLNNPAPDEAICGCDRLVLAGTKDQLGRAIDLLRQGGASNSRRDVAPS